MSKAGRPKWQARPGPKVTQGPKALPSSHAPLMLMLLISVTATLAAPLMQPGRMRMKEGQGQPSLRLNERWSLVAPYERSLHAHNPRIVTRFGRTIILPNLGKCGRHVILAARYGTLAGLARANASSNGVSFYGNPVLGSLGYICLSFVPRDPGLTTVWSLRTAGIIGGTPTLEDGSQKASRVMPTCYPRAQVRKLINSPVGDAIKVGLNRTEAWTAPPDRQRPPHPKANPIHEREKTKMTKKPRSSAPFISLSSFGNAFSHAHPGEPEQRIGSFHRDAPPVRSDLPRSISASLPFQVGDRMNPVTHFNRRPLRFVLCFAGNPSLIRDACTTAKKLALACCGLLVFRTSFNSMVFASITQRTRNELDGLPRGPRGLQAHSPQACHPRNEAAMVATFPKQLHGRTPGKHDGAIASLQILYRTTGLFEAAPATQDARTASETWHRQALRVPLIAVAKQASDVKDLVGYWKVFAASLGSEFRIWCREQFSSILGKHNAIVSLSARYLQASAYASNSKWRYF
ncbi:uncharacterized protein CLUP02_11079 [Colletotrichum lupini]|uniref:Uncharacterized protein n=1 Tax=Colletotrichum lupini TaxID=145971 RepID=A0A9Q8WK58_9PEZI|nr:uncharacterized protein CLUP02_11079 [Colletotrichum lupini]UQC85580.1 hypothetical protein CLUP02_11079 [Colletotrichum lupini]